MAKRFVDIEHALRWAYRDELPKRQQGDGSWIGGTALSPVGGMISAADEGSVDGEPGYAAARGEPHPEVLAIEAAVKGLGAWVGYGFGPDDAAGLMHGIEHMDVDHVQAGVEAVAAMPAIVAVHARAGSRPRWSWELPVPLPDRGGNGKPRVMIDEIFVESYDRKGVFYAPAPAEIPPGTITYVQSPARRFVRASTARAPIARSSIGPGRRASSRSGRNTRLGGWGWKSLRASLPAAWCRSRRSRPLPHGGRGLASAIRTDGRRNSSKRSAPSRIGASLASRPQRAVGLRNGGGLRRGPRTNRRESFPRWVRRG